jgi:hypothetical protein
MHNDVFIVPIGQEQDAIRILCVIKDNE